MWNLSGLQTKAVQKAMDDKNFHKAVELRGRSAKCFMRLTRVFSDFVTLTWLCSYEVIF